MENIKDVLSTICGWITVIGGAVLGAQAAGQIVLSATVTGIIGTVVAIALAVTQFLTGKLPNGQAKAPEQVQAQNSGK
jgi:hypothetical protein